MLNWLFVSPAELTGTPRRCGAGERIADGLCRRQVATDKISARFIDLGVTAGHWCFLPGQDKHGVGIEILRHVFG